MRVLITGGRGQLARSLQRALVTHDVIALGRDELDVTVEPRVRTVIERYAPSIVIHAAALTDTTRCERAPEEAAGVNAAGAANAARACELVGARLIAISTDEVFDGQQRSPYTESDATRAINGYGASKLQGERMAAAACSDTLIVRTSWLYGDGGNTFPAKVMAAARAGGVLRFVTDEVSAPTSTDDLGAAIVQLVEVQAPPGIYHLVNEGEASRYEWAREVLRLAGLRDVAMEPVTVAELRRGGYNGPRKPAYSVMANTRARALGITLRPWREALACHFERARVAPDG